MGTYCSLWQEATWTRRCTDRASRARFQLNWDANLKGHGSRKYAEMLVGKWVLEAPLPQRDTVECGHEFDASGCRHECDSGIILVEPDSEGPTGNYHWGLGCLARLRNTRNPIVVPRECIEQDLNNRITSDSRESEIKTRMPGTSDPSDPSCSSRYHLADGPFPLWPHQRSGI